MEGFHERGASTETKDDSPSYLPEVLFKQGRLGEGDDVIQEDLTGSGTSLTEADYVSISTLTLSHLPLPIRSEAVLEAIKAVGARVVRVSVHTLSPGRRGTFADKQGDLNKGTGFAVFIHTLFIIVSTNRHVVFDDFEARHSTIEFFADDKENLLRDVRFFQGHGVISAHSDHDFALVVYWLQRGYPSLRWDPESVRCHKDLTPFCFPHLAYTHATPPTGEEDKGTSDTTGHISPDASAEPNSATGKAEMSAEVTKTTAEKYVCVIAHPEGDTKHVSFGKILHENDVTQEVRHTAPTRPGSSGAPILIVSPCATDVPPDSIWYHCGQLKEARDTKVARLQPNTAQLFAVEFNRGLVGWKLLSDLLDKLQPHQEQPQAAEGDGIESSASTNVAGKGEPQEKTKELPPASDPSSGDVLVTHLPSGLTVACKLLTWIYSAGEATLHHNFLDLPETSSSQHPPVKPQPPTSSSSAEPPTSPSPLPPDHACLVEAFQRLVSQVSGLLGDEKVDSLMHPVSFLTLAKAVKDLHSAVHNHDPCCCRELSVSGDMPVPSAGPESQATPTASGPTTPLPQPEGRMGCLLQSTLELLSAFLSDPRVNVLESLPVLNLLFRLATHLVRVVVLHQALDKTRTLTTEEAKEGKEAAVGSRPERGSEAVSTAAENDDEKDKGAGLSRDGRLDAGQGKRSLAELAAIFSDCFGSFLSISDAWAQVNQDWTEAKSSEAISESSGNPSSEEVQSKKSSNTCRPDRRFVQKELKAFQGKLQKSCSRYAKSTTPTDAPSPSASQQEEDAKTIAVMAAIINAFPYMYRGLDDSQGRENVCQRFQAVQSGDRSQEISKLEGELESVLQTAYGVLILATSAWEGLQKVEDGSTQELTPGDQGSSAASQEARSEATGNPEESQRKVSDAGREHAARESHVSSSSEQATVDPRQPGDQSETTEVQTAVKQQQPSTPTTGAAKQSEFPPPSEPEHQIFFHLCMIGFATLLESGGQCTALMRFQEQLAKAPGVAELREKLRKSGGRTMMQGWMGAVSIDAFSPEDERFKACPELFTEISRFGRNILVEGIRQLSDMRSADVPSLDDVVARARAAKEAMARQAAAQKQEAEVGAGSSSSTPETAEMDGKGSDTSQDPATESRSQGREAGVEGASEDQAAGSQGKDAAPQGKASSAGFLESTVNTYKDVLEVMKQPEVLKNLPQAMAPFQPRAAQPSQSQTPPSTKP